MNEVHEAGNYNIQPPKRRHDGEASTETPPHQADPLAQYMQNLAAILSSRAGCHQRHQVAEPECRPEAGDGQC